MSLCCERCFDETWIRQHIEKQGRRGKCDYCGARQVAVAPTKVVGCFVRTGLQRAYHTAEELGLLCDPELGIYPADIDLDSVDGILSREEAIFSEALLDARQERRLISDLIDDSAPGTRAVQRGGSDWLQGGKAMLALRNVLEASESNPYSEAWERFKQTIKFQSRFFDQRGEVPRYRLLKPLEPLLPAMTTILVPGSTFVRARRLEGRLPEDEWQWQEALGPPPVSSATHSRMSPQGISYLYLCDTEATAVAEIRPNVGWRLRIARFVLRRALRIVDCTKVPTVRLRPIFDPKYEHDRRWAGHFFEHFCEDISQPLPSRDNPLEYIPTQAFAEFLRARGFDGLRYRSSQAPAGVNITLFCSPADDVARGYSAERPFFHEWVQLQRVSTVVVSRVQFEVETKSVRSVMTPDLQNSRTERARHFLPGRDAGFGVELSPHGCHRARFFVEHGGSYL